MSSHQHDDKHPNKLLRIATITCVLSVAAIAAIFCGGIRENLSRDSVTTPPTTTPVVSTYVATTNPHIVVAPPPTEGISPVPTGPTSDTPVDSWCHQWSDPESRIVILCLGDSITYGNGSHDNMPELKRPHRGNFPLTMREPIVAGLQAHAIRLRCPFVPSPTQIVVHNFGVPGASLTPGRIWYQSHATYEKALAVVNASLVLVMLGTNDSIIWQNVTYFIDHYLKLISRLRMANKLLPVIILAPPPCFPLPNELRSGKCNFHPGVSCEGVMDSIRNASRTISAATEGVTYVDTFNDIMKLHPQLLRYKCLRNQTTAMSDIVNVKDLSLMYSDGVHPTPKLSHDIGLIAATAVLKLLQAS